MLPQQQRLRHQQEFDLLRQQGVSYNQPLFRLVVLKQSSMHQRIGFIVSKQVSKKATQRNLVKRRLRAAYRSLNPDASIGGLLLFIARPASLSASYQEILEQMQNALRKSKFLPVC